MFYDFLFVDFESDTRLKFKRKMYGNGREGTETVGRTTKNI